MIWILLTIHHLGDFVKFLWPSKKTWLVRFHQIFGLLFLLDNSSPVLCGPFFCLAINDEVSNFWQKNAHPRRYGRSLTSHSMKINTRNICILFQNFIVLAAIKWKMVCHTRLWKQSKPLSFKRWLRTYLIAIDTAYKKILFKMLNHCYLTISVEF